VSNPERDKWDERYRAGAYEERPHPTALLADWLPRLPRGAALDVACGAGRNAVFLAANGYAVTAVDISAVGIERGRRRANEQQLAVDWLCADLDEPGVPALPAARYDLIVWIRYIQRALMPHLISRLAPGGVLLCEQHLATSAAVAGPSNPSFRLQPGELRASAVGLQALLDHEGQVIDPDGRSVMLAQLVAAAN
jgi:SAM-dependent methyltransferase